MKQNSLVCSKSDRSFEMSKILERGVVECTKMNWVPWDSQTDPCPHAPQLKIMCKQPQIAKVLVLLFFVFC